MVRHNAKDNPPWITALVEVRAKATREGWCYQHVQAIIVSIDQYTEAATGNRDTSSTNLTARRQAITKSRAAVSRGAA